MKKILVCCFLFITFFSPVELFAEELELQDFIYSALENNPSIIKAGQRVSAAGGEKTEALGNFFPQLSASGRFSYTDTVPELDFVMPVAVDPDTEEFIYEEMAVEMGQKDSYRAQLELRQPIFTFGSIRGAYRISAHLHNIENLIYRRSKYFLLSKVKKAHYGVLFAGEIVDIAEKHKSLMEENLDTTRGLYKAGRLSNLDVNRVRSYLLKAQKALSEARMLLKQSREGLFNISVIEDKGQKIAGELEYGEFDGELEEILKEAFKQRQELEVAGLNVDIARRRKSIESAENLPALFAFASYNLERPDQRLRDEWGESWVAGGIIEFPLPGVSRPGKMRRLNARISQAQAEKQKQKDSIKLEVKNNFHRVRSLGQSIKLMEENLRITSVSLETARRQYEKGQISNMELNQAIIDYTSAKREYAATAHEFLSGLEDLKLSAGGKLPGGGL